MNYIQSISIAHGITFAQKVSCVVGGEETAIVDTSTPATCIFPSGVVGQTVVVPDGWTDDINIGDAWTFCGPGSASDVPVLMFNTDGTKGFLVSCGFVLP